MCVGCIYYTYTIYIYNMYYQALGFIIFHMVFWPNTAYCVIMISHPLECNWPNDQQMSVLPNELLKGTLRDQVFDEAFGHKDSIHSRGFVTPSLLSSILSLTCGFVTHQFNLVILMPRCWVNWDSQRFTTPRMLTLSEFGEYFFFITQWY